MTTQRDTLFTSNSPRHGMIVGAAAFAANDEAAFVVRDTR